MEPRRTAPADWRGSGEPDSLRRTRRARAAAATLVAGTRAYKRAGPAADSRTPDRDRLRGARIRTVPARVHGPRFELTEWHSVIFWDMGDPYLATSYRGPGRLAQLRA